MKLFGLEVIEYADMPAEEAWIIRRHVELDSLPPSLRACELPVPCIVTGNITLLKEAMILAKLVSLKDVTTPQRRNRRSAATSAGSGDRVGASQPRRKQKAAGLKEGVRR